MDLNIIIAICFTHFLADFVAQTHKQAIGKSKNWGDLLSHTLTYTFTWVGLWFILGLFSEQFHNIVYDIKWLYFLIVTFIHHTMTDFVTSRINSKLWEKKQVHKFFVGVGADQFIHYSQLFITFEILFK